MKQTVKYPSVIEAVNRLTDFEKLEIWLRYYTANLCIKKDFHIVDKLKQNWNIGWGVPTKSVYNTALYHTNGFDITSFEDFISESNIEVRDLGEDWQEKNFAQRYWVQVYGIYAWVQKDL